MGRPRLPLLVGFAVVMSICGDTSAGSHTPLSWRSNLGPSESVVALQQCMARHIPKINRTQPLKSAWAGKVLQDRQLWPGVVAGPILPKAMSTSLRAFYGKINRPPGLTDVKEALATAGGSPRDFWFAVVRDPLTRFVDAYIQVGSSRPRRFQVPEGGGAGRADGADEAGSSGGEWCEFKKVREYDPGNFCAQPLACRRLHFENWVLDHNMETHGREHRAPQVRWLAPAVERLDAVLRLENIQDDWEQAVALSSDWDTFVSTANESMDAMLTKLRVPKRAKAPLRLLGSGGDACTMWEQREPGTSSVVQFEQLLQDNLLQWLTPEWMRRVCRLLVLDYTCLRYALPEMCQLVLAHDPGST